MKSYESQAETGRKRKYYRLTKKGGKLLRQKQEEWEVYENEIRSVMTGGVSLAL